MTKKVKPAGGPMSPPTQLRKELVDMLQNLTGRYDTYTVFRDWVAMCAAAISNACDLRQAKEREEEYMRVVGKYHKEEAEQLAKAFGKLQIVMECERFGDFMGDTFMGLEISNRDTGQFFTPYHLCEFMARISLNEIDERIQEKGYITLAEPACGSGAMVIAAAEVLLEKGHNPQTQMHATLMDIDLKCVQMAYVQLSLLGIPAVVVHGNTITMEEWSHWVTPMHIIGGWDWRLKGKRSPAEIIGGLTEMLTTETNSFVLPKPEQLALFEEAA